MKSSVWERLVVRHLLPALPGFASKGKLIFRSPIGSLLHGFALDDSRNPDGGYANVFVQPLFDPVRYVYVSHGYRLGGSSHFWDVDPQNPEPGVRAIRDAIMSEGLPFLQRLDGPAAFARYIEEVRASRPTPRPGQPLSPRPRPAFTPGYVFDIAGCHAWLGDAASALAELAKLQLNSPGSLNDPVSKTKLVVRQG